MIESILSKQFLILLKYILSRPLHGLSYLENYRRGIYSRLLLSGELKRHLLMIQEQAETRFDLLVEQIAWTYMEALENAAEQGEELDKAGSTALGGT